MMELPIMQFYPSYFIPAVTHLLSPLFSKTRSVYFPLNVTNVT
jgi:hypothetical protein